MSNLTSNFWIGPVRPIFRAVAFLFCVLLLAGAALFAELSWVSNNWIQLAWVPIMVFNAAGMAGIARTGYWLRFRGRANI